MSKKMLVNATHPEENRVAIVMDGILTELDVEVSGREPTKGNIYKAVVVRVEPGLQAAFVDYGAERLGFLQIDEVNPATVNPDFTQSENSRARPRINELLQRGQEILVQITKEERGTKGAALTTYLSLAGRFMVCMPASQTRGVSRKVESDAERKQLKKAMASLDLPDNIGYIVRTAGLGKTQEDLQRDFNYLTRLYDGIRDLAKSAKAPALIYKESNLVIRSIRDYFTTEMDEVLIDDPDVYKEARDFFQRVMPEHAGLVKLHQERRPIFSRYQIEDQIETINQNKVQLPSGGSIVIDQTEALVAIDVNSGRMTSEQGVESTAYKTNVEAAEEIGRQLRLRDLGGLIVIDFIDMRDRKHGREVENTLKKSLENDKARVAIGRISSKFGLLEMSRQRIKSALTEGTLLSCPHCQGTGRIKSQESLAVDLMRRIHTGVAKGQIGKVDAQLPLDVASYLLNHKREEIYELERRHNLQIHLHGRPDFTIDQIEIEFQKREKEKQVQTEYVEAGTLPPEPEAEKAEQPAEVAAEETIEETTEKPRKRRRRRRRKPASERTEAAAAQQAAAGQETAAAESREQVQPATDMPQDQTQAVESTTAEMAPAQSSETETRPKRRRSSRRKTTAKPVATEETTTEATPASVPQRETEAPAAPMDQGEADEQITPPASATETDITSERGSAPRRKSGMQADSMPPQQTGATESTEATQQPATDQAVAAPAETPEKPKRRRAPRKKAATEEHAASQQPGATDSTEAAQQPATDQTVAAPAETPEKPKRRRAPRKKAATEEHAASQQPGATDSTEAAQPPAEDKKVAVQAETEEKPKRRRAPRKKAAAQEPAETVQPPADDQNVAAQTETEEKPKRRRAPRKKAAAQEPAETVQPPANDQNVAAQTETEEKPKRRRAPRKKPTQKATAETE